MELGLTRKEINSILFQYDKNDDGNISYTEFIPFAFDLLSKLTEMKIFQLQTQNDELNTFLSQIFQAHEADNAGADPNREDGMIKAEDAKGLLHKAELGLTRLQIYSVLQAADVHDNGYLNYMQFLPKAVSMMRSMLSFEADLASQVETREQIAAVQAALKTIEGAATRVAVQTVLADISILDKITKDAIIQYVDDENKLSLDTLSSEVGFIIKNMKKTHLVEN